MVKGRETIHSVNLRFGRGKKAEQWITVIDRACELAAEADEAFSGESIPRNEWIRNVLLRNRLIKQAADELGIKIEHPPKRGTYDQALAERRARRRARAEQN